MREKIIYTEKKGEERRIKEKKGEEEKYWLRKYLDKTVTTPRFDSLGIGSSVL